MMIVVVYDPVQHVGYRRVAMVDWAEGAACVGMPSEWWFPEEGAGRPSELMYAKARPVCARCPVRVECLEETLTFEKVYGRGYRVGMWGGLSPRERDRLRKSVAA